MKLLITGMCGFIGSHLADAAIKAGHKVVGVDCLTYAGRRQNTLGLTNYKADICDAGQMEHILNEFQPAAVIHLAAETHVARSIEDREAFLRTNVLGTDVLLSECLKYWQARSVMSDWPADRFRFVHVSTDEVYGSLTPSELPWTELSPYAPNNPYSASKAAADHLVRAYWKTYGLPTIITHSANNYGTRQHPEKLIPTLVRQCMAGEQMTLHGDGLHIRDWLHVEDHCRGLLAAAESGHAGGVYNFGGSCERDNRQIALMVGSHIPSGGFPIKFIEDRPGNDRRYSSNCGKAFNHLNWVSDVPIEARIADVVKWYVDHPNYDTEYGR